MCPFPVANPAFHLGYEAPQVARDLLFRFRRPNRLNLTYRRSGDGISGEESPVSVLERVPSGNTNI